MESFPTKFGRYELLDRIAVGGMAQIYRARLRAAEGTSKELVIKRILPHLAQNRDFIDMFIDEARITMPLNHGNIVQVFEFGQEGEDYFLAMEYVHGRNLESILSRLDEAGDNMPVYMALYIASEVAKGLDFAHRFKGPDNKPAGIIHRDVSPQNVLVGFQGQVKLTDFGIAKAKSRIRQTAAGIIQGKACYLSPEQAECRELDHRSDQFSLAIVLYEMLTGIRPFEGESEVATLDKVRNASVEPPSVHRAGIPAAVEGALLKALSKNPADRFPSMAEFQVVLSRTLHELAPDLTPVYVGEWVQQLFPAESEEEGAGPSTKQRMAERLAREGVEVNPVMRTEELLQLGTVAIKKEEAEPEKQPDGIQETGVLELDDTRSKEQEDTGREQGGRSKLKLVLGVVVLIAALWFGIPPLRDLMLGVEPLFPADRQGPGQSDAGRGGPDEPVGDDDLQGGKQESADQGKTTEEASGYVHEMVRQQKYGYVNLNASPWAYVEVDGKRLKKETPIFRLKVPANKRVKIKFINPELKLVRTKFVTVPPGGTKSVTVVLAEP